MILKRCIGVAGMQQQARRLIGVLLDRGVDVRLVYRGESNRSPKLFQRLKMPTEPVGGKRSYWFGADLYRHLLRHRDQFDILHLHGTGDELLALLPLARRLRCPLVVKPSTAGSGTSLHGWSTLLRPVPALTRCLFGPVSRWAALSSVVEEDLLRAGVPADRITRLPNGVDVEAFRPLESRQRQADRQAAGLQPEDVVFVTVARLSPHKQVDVLIRGFARAAKGNPHARLWIIGGGPEEVGLRTLSHELGVDPQVEFLGRLRPGEVPGRLQLADAFALVSRWEGLSNALLEAMATGLTPVVSRVSGSDDLIRPDDNGLLVDGANEAEVHSALERVLTKPELRQRIGQSARETVQRDYSLDDIAARYHRLYEELLDARSPAAAPLPARSKASR